MVDRALGAGTGRDIWARQVARPGEGRVAVTDWHGHAHRRQLWQGTLDIRCPGSKIVKIFISDVSKVTYK